MISFLEYLLESAESDQYEVDVAENIQQFSVDNNLGWNVERPHVSTKYSDVRVIAGDTTSWIEVKMNVTDQLGTPRFFYKDGKWQSNMHTPIGKDICRQLDNSTQAANFISKLAAFTGIDEKQLYLSPSKAEIKKANIPGIVTLQQLNDYANENGRYIAKQNFENIDKVLAKHYLKGKMEPAQYVQIGDNFFMLDKNINPLNFANVPIIKGSGILNVRFATRSEFYEIQAEIKFNKSKFAESNVSFKPGSNKPFPTVK